MKPLTDKQASLVYLQQDIDIASERMRTHKKEYEFYKKQLSRLKKRLRNHT